MAVSTHTTRAPRIFGALVIAGVLIGGAYVGYDSIVQSCKVAMSQIFNGLGTPNQRLNRRNSRLSRQNLEWQATLSGGTEPVR